MKFFKRNKDKESKAIVCNTPSTARNEYISLYSNCNTLTKAEFDLYRSLRESIPIIDSAIDKIVRLVGSFQVVATNSKVQKQLDNFVEEVSLAGGNNGMYQFVMSFLGEMLTYGQAVGEIVLTKNNQEIAGLYNCDLSNVDFVAGKNPFDYEILNRSTNTIVPNRNLIVSCLMNPESGKLKGTSILRSLPFVSSILVKVFKSIGTNWDRAGNIRYAVTYKPEGASSVSANQAKQIADEWSKAMHSTEVCDFVSVGDVNIKVIGADSQILDCDMPIKHLLEQIVAKLSLPPFVLGLSWSSTERMSAQQADILTSELEYYRSLLSPIIKKICRMYLKLNGLNSDVEVNWNLINLQDEVELSQSRLNNAQALEIEQRIKEEYKLEVDYEDGTSY